MSASDYLKSARDDGANASKPVKDSDPMRGDPDEANSTSRIIKLSDDEQKAFEGAGPGQELRCDVRGNLEEDGHFHVMSVSPYGGASSYGEDRAAYQVAQKVNPFMGMMK